MTGRQRVWGKCSYSERLLKFAGFACFLVAVMHFLSCSQGDNLGDAPENDSPAEPTPLSEAERESMKSENENPFLDSAPAESNNVILQQSDGPLVTLASIEELNELSRSVIQSSTSKRDVRQVLVHPRVKLTGRAGDRTKKGKNLLDCGWYTFDVNPMWPTDVVAPRQARGKVVTVIGQLYWVLPYTVAAPDNSDASIHGPVARESQPPVGTVVEGHFYLYRYEVIEIAEPGKDEAANGNEK